MLDQIECVSEFVECEGAEFLRDEAGSFPARRSL